MCGGGEGNKMGMGVGVGKFSNFGGRNFETQARER